ncbi:hypothetical protein BaRGS_00031458, partial [Batillaria attramentaria]
LRRLVLLTGHGEVGLAVCLLFMCQLTILPQTLPHQQGTAGVRWVLYGKLKLTWNEASQFCADRGGHLPVTNTSLYYSYWTGLHSTQPGTAASVWEKDCSSVNDPLDLWTEPEPDDVTTDLCVRIRLGYSFFSRWDVAKWETTLCSRRHLVVCEHSQGDCWFETISNVIMTSATSVSIGDVGDVSRCRSLCLSYQLPSECVAAQYDKVSKSCDLYLGDSLLVTSDVETTPSTSSTLLLRRCFEGL